MVELKNLHFLCFNIQPNTVEPLLKDTLKQGHLCAKDTLLCPQCAFLVEIYP